jgi:hypothetical protein
LRVICDHSERPASSSTISTERRRRPSWIAAARPAGPPPITTQSKESAGPREESDATAAFWPDRRCDAPGRAAAGLVLSR